MPPLNVGSCVALSQPLATLAGEACKGLGFIERMHRLTPEVLAERQSIGGLRYEQKLWMTTRQ